MNNFYALTAGAWVVTWACAGCSTRQATGDHDRNDGGPSTEWDSGDLADGRSTAPDAADSDAAGANDHWEPVPDPSEEHEAWSCVDETFTPRATDARTLVVETTHYRLTVKDSNATEVADLGRRLEAAWPAFADYIGAEPALDPDERLNASLYPTYEEFAAAIRQAGEQPPADSGGYYSIITRNLFLYRQPTAYFTAMLLLHEALHQFHYLAQDLRANPPFWYGEGAAEYLSRHDWDGRCLRAGRPLMLSQEDLPRQAWSELTTNGFDLPGVIAGEVQVSRPGAWTLYAFLERGAGGAYAAGFRTFRDRMDRGLVLDPVSSFEELVGDPDVIADEILSWLPTAQEPLEVVFVDWLHVAPGRARCVSATLSFARVKEDVTRLRLTFDPPTDGEWYGGLLYSFDDTSNYEVVLVTRSGELSRFAVVGGAVRWDRVGSIDPTACDGTSTWTAVHERNMTLLSLCGQERSLPRAFAASGGPALYGATLDFRDIAWQ